jgi:HEAT repeat protein
VEQRYLTAFALGEIGPEARSALPQLRVLCADSNELVYASAQAAVIKITGSGIDALIAALGDTFDSAKWNQACAAVGFLGNAGSNAIPVLLATTAHGDSVAVEKAIEALGKIHTRPELCIPGVLPFLQNTNEWVRLHSLSSISAFGTNARRFVATSDLVRCLGDPSRLVRETATNTLRYLAPEAAVKAGISMDP